MDERTRPPALEGEIIPPQRPGGPRDDGQAHARIWIRTGAGGYERVARPGPFALLMALLAFGGFALVVLLIVLGAFLVLIPVAVATIALLVLSRLLGRNSRA